MKTIYIFYNVFLYFIAFFFNYGRIYILFLISTQFAVEVCLLWSVAYKWYMEMVHTISSVSCLVLYCLDIIIMFFMISVNGTMYISVSHSVAYVLYWNFYDFKNFFIYCMFKPLSCSTKVCWNHPFSYYFLSVTVEIQFQNIFNLCC